MLNRNRWLLGLFFVLAAILAACSSGGATETAENFPTGKFVAQDDRFSGKYFNEDGTWTSYFAGETVAEGTYSVDGNLLIEETNDQTCPAPMSYQYSFDGVNLKFQLTDESREDPCQSRAQSFDGITYVLTE